MLIGVILVLAGVILAARPLDAARFANNLRFVPYSDTPGAVRYYRISGSVTAAIGVVVAVLLT